MMHASQEVEGLVRKLRVQWGHDRVSQTNSRKNGKFSVVRVFDRAADKGKPSKALATAETLEELRDMVDRFDLLNCREL